MGRRGLFALLTLLAAWAAVEGIAALAFAFGPRFQSPPRPHSTWDDYVASVGPGEIARFRLDHYDPVLGWDVRADHLGITEGWSYSPTRWDRGSIPTRPPDPLPRSSPRTATRSRSATA